MRWKHKVIGSSAHQTYMYHTTDYYSASASASASVLTLHRAPHLYGFGRPPSIPARSSATSEILRPPPTASPSLFTFSHHAHPPQNVTPHPLPQTLESITFTAAAFTVTSEHLSSRLPNRTVTIQVSKHNTVPPPFYPAFALPIRNARRRKFKLDFLGLAVLPITDPQLRRPLRLQPSLYPPLSASAAQRVLYIENSNDASLKTTVARSVARLVRCRHQRTTAS